MTRSEILIIGARMIQEEQQVPRRCAPRDDTQQEPGMNPKMLINTKS
jgi:hypothetical protein